MWKKPSKEEKTSKDKLEELHKGHSIIIVRDCQFFGYGILISLFHFGREFFNTYPFIAVLTSLISIITLCLVYFFSSYQFLRAETILKTIKESHLPVDENDTDCSYKCMRKMSLNIFWSIQVFLIFSLISFLFCCYLYFFRYPRACV